jgi:hypothetical protein
MRAHQIDLQLADLLGRDADRGELAEAGVDAAVSPEATTRSTTAREAFIRWTASSARETWTP